MVSDSHTLLTRPLRVLLVEDSDEEPSSVVQVLDEIGASRVEYAAATELSEALKRLSEGGVDIVLLSLALPDSSGFDALDRVCAFAPDVPVVVLSDVTDEETAIAVVQAGAQDYLADGDLQQNTVLKSLRYAVERHRLVSALQSLSLIDDLTGLYNQRAFTDLGKQYLKLARRSGRGIALVCLDVDRLRTINDTLGHHVGDRALLKIAEILRATFRRSDIVGRIGGDEFAVLALEASGTDEDHLVGRLKDQFERFNERNRESYQLSVSVGVARDDAQARVPVRELLDQAEAAMHEEKRTKRKAVTR